MSFWVGQIQGNFLFQICTKPTGILPRPSQCPQNSKTAQHDNSIFDLTLLAQHSEAHRHAFLKTMPFDPVAASGRGTPFLRTYQLHSDLGFPPIPARVCVCVPFRLDLSHPKPLRGLSILDDEGQRRPIQPIHFTQHRFWILPSLAWDEMAAKMPARQGTAEVRAGPISTRHAGGRRSYRRVRCITIYTRER